MDGTKTRADRNLPDGTSPRAGIIAPASAKNAEGWATRHVVISAHRATGSGCNTPGTCDLTYDSISFDNVSTPCTSFTDTCTLNGADSLGWPVGTLVQNVQVDEAGASSGSYQFYTDIMTTNSPQSTQVATPTFSPSGGDYDLLTVTVTISTTTSGATICYTTDGTTPIGNGGGGCIHGTTYSTPITLGSDNVTLNAIGTKDGYDFDSAVGTAVYVFD